MNEDKVKCSQCQSSVLPKFKRVWDKQAKHWIQFRHCPVCNCIISAKMEDKENE